MREPVERLREKAQNEKAVIGLSDLLRLAKEENKALRTRVARLEETLQFILNECYWEPTYHESGGDERIGTAARRALEEK